MSRRLILVRHGESHWNTEGRIQGHHCAGLSPRGHDQAVAVGQALASMWPGATVVSSDLQRAAETAQAIASALATDVHVDTGVRERNFGRWEGCTKEEIAADDPHRWQRWERGDDVVSEVGGEPGRQFADRVAAALTALWDRTVDGATTVVVTHGGTIWHGLHRVLEVRPGTFGGVHNASTTSLVRRDGGRVRCEHWNDIGHLPAGLRSAKLGDGTGRIMGS